MLFTLIHAFSVIPITLLSYSLLVYEDYGNSWGGGGEERAYLRRALIGGNTDHI